MKPKDTRRNSSISHKYIYVYNLHTHRDTYIYRHTHTNIHEKWKIFGRQKSIYLLRDLFFADFENYFY
jgi:hypothetical protein